MPRKPWSLPEFGFCYFKPPDSLAAQPVACRWCGSSWWRCQGVLICPTCDRTVTELTVDE